MLNMEMNRYKGYYYLNSFITEIKTIFENIIYVLRADNMSDGLNYCYTL